MTSLTLEEAALAFERAGVDRPRLQAEALLARAMGGIDRSRLLAGTVAPDARQLHEFSNLCRRRVSREPLEYLLGRVDFCGLSLACDRRALIPRPETEDLVELAARRMKSHPTPSVADVGTGTGAIALALKARLPDARLTATDLSRDALDLASANARSLGLEVLFRQGRDLEPLGDARFDAILGNPPYIADAEMPGLMPEVRDWEPHTALRGGPDGTEILSRWIASAPRHLAPGGWMAVEIGYTQAARVLAFFQSAGFSDITTTMDFAGIGRFVSGSLHGGRRGTRG